MASPRATLPDHAPEVRRALVDVARVCEELGIERSRTERGKWTCPRHGGGSLSVRLGRDRTIQARCFGCDFAGDVLTLIAEARGLNVSRDFREVLAEGARIGGLWAALGNFTRARARDGRNPGVLFPMAFTFEPPERSAFTPPGRRDACDACRDGS
jgi:hypothetical protein